MYTPTSHPSLPSTQYFLGSSYAWSCEQDTKSKHTVPKEIVTKVFLFLLLMLFPR